MKNRINSAPKDMIRRIGGEGGVIGGGGPIGGGNQWGVKNTTDIMPGGRGRTMPEPYFGGVDTPGPENGITKYGGVQGGGGMWDDSPVTPDQVKRGGGGNP